MNDSIKTRLLASGIVDVVEGVLIENNIRVPSPEDDERSKYDVGLYGSTYSDILDTVEQMLIAIVKEVKDNPDVTVITDVF